MANAIATRIGAVNQDATTLDKERALMLKVFAGEVLTAFRAKSTVLDRHFIRTIKNGKSAQFPLMGLMPAAEYHTPGTEILGQKANHGERVITIDKLLISHTFIADIDEAMNHYDVRSKYSAEMGYALANTFDQHVYREIIKAARTAANDGYSGAPGGKVHEVAALGSATEATKYEAWVKIFFDIAAEFDNKSIPHGSRFVAVKPDTFYFIMQKMGTNGFSLLHKDIGGSGSIAQGTLGPIAGLTLISTPNLPFADYSTEEFHAVNAKTTVGVAWTPDAVGTVKLMDLSMQSEYDIRRQGTLMVGRYAMGHGVLRPECAQEIRTAAPTA